MQILAESKTTMYVLCVTGIDMSVPVMVNLCMCLVEEEQWRCLN